VMGKKCKAIHTSNQERKCFNVNELLCTLKENVQFEEIPAVFTVQKCHKMKERVCDTVYETELTEKDDYKCITVVNPYCAKKDRTVYDKTCRTMVNFDCKAHGGNSYGGSSSGSGDSNYGGTSGGYGDSTSGGYGDSKYEPELNATSRTKLNATQYHVLSQLSTVKTEKRKSARSLLRRFLFQLKGKIVMMKIRKHVN